MASILVEFAAAVSLWFPEMKNRVVAVLDSDIKADNIPTLPLVMVALVNETSNYNPQTNASPKIVEDFIVEFWMEPQKYEVEEGKSPFWAFYDYDMLRNRILKHLPEFVSSRDVRVQYVSLQTDNMQFAAIITMRFTHTYEWCDLEEEERDCSPTLDGRPLNITFSLQVPPQAYCDDECAKCKEEEKETCP